MGQSSLYQMEKIFQHAMDYLFRSYCAPVGASLKLSSHQLSSIAGLLFLHRRQPSGMLPEVSIPEIKQCALTDWQLSLQADQPGLCQWNAGMATHVADDVGIPDAHVSKPLGYRPFNPMGPPPPPTDRAPLQAGPPAKCAAPRRAAHLQPDVQHHGGHDVEIGEVDAELPG